MNFTKSFLVALFLLFFALTDAGAERLNFSFSSLVGSQSPLWVAKEVGFFKKHGIDAQVVYIVGGRVVVQAMLAGELQMGIAGPGAVIRANLAGADFVYVAVSSNMADFVLVTPRRITDIQQLRGKRIGIGQFGGGPDYTTRIVLEKHGLIPDKDVRIVQMLTGQPGRLAALQSEAIEGIVISPPLTLQAKQLGFNLLVDYSEVIANFFTSGFIATRRYVQQNPQTVENAVKALLDAVRYIFANEEGATRIIGRYMKITDGAFLRQYYREVALKQINRTLYPDVKAIEFVLDQERRTNPALAQIRPENFVDTRFLDKLRKEGY
ncbi:MAG: NrtA/SsuA/CpmA family ABC transporter substrate-binding protein [Deltaproteobacteria bacterium]|nr:NrtA/SsuA/CpmA family ABC transporter substrate-binding protein [Deltaproteobacteria bacterium]